MGTAQVSGRLQGLAGGALLDALGCLGIARGQFLERLAGIPGLAERRQRHAELEQRIRRLAALRIFLEALGEGERGVVVVLPHIECLAQPVAGIAGQRMLGILIDEGAQRLLRIAVLVLPQQVEGILVLLVRRRALQGVGPGGGGLRAWSCRRSAAGRRRGGRGIGVGVEPLFLRIQFALRHRAEHPRLAGLRAERHHEVPHLGHLVALGVEDRQPDEAGREDAGGGGAHGHTR